MSNNNLPYNIAGYVIEKVSGISWFEFVQGRILDPLGLDKTYLKPSRAGTDQRRSMLQCA